AAGPGYRLCRIHRSLDRFALTLRDFGERPLRRSDAHQIAARPRLGRRDAHELRAGARAPRWHHGAQARSRSVERSGSAVDLFSKLAIRGARGPAISRPKAGTGPSRHTLALTPLGRACR